VVPEGGSPDVVALLARFLLADGDVHLDDVIEGPHEPTPPVLDLRLPTRPSRLERPAYLLTSATTYAGGEELT
jgi:hypothetical protein